MGTGRPIIALIHASEASMAPAVAAFADAFPDAQLWHLLDNRLVTDADAAGGLTPPLRERMTTLIQYAVDGGADGVQLSCSMYGPVALKAAELQPVTVLASDQAMFEHVANARPKRVGVLGSLAAASTDSAERLRAWLESSDMPVEIEHRTVDGAADAANRSDLATLERLMLEAARDLAREVDLIVLAQYSLAPVLPSLAEEVEVPVLSAPHLAATHLAQVLGGRP